ncbi:phage baseplate assembly protein V [Erwiniaceae bacterium L1_54_6]|nr:phage baseplate assembly protein V [Erwiniaceae bacterium L1_54_6]
MNDLTLPELYRLVMNMIRIGTVIEVDLLMTVARVQTGGLQTDWIRWGADRAGDAVTWWAPSVGEQVVLFAPGGALENAVIAFSLYSQDTLPPDNGKKTNVTRYPDGARKSYDPVSGVLSLLGMVSGVVSMSETLTLNLGRLIINADVIINGQVVQGGGAMSSNGVIVDDHAHDSVKKGDEMSGGPH